MNSLPSIESASRTRSHLSIGPAAATATQRALPYFLGAWLAATACQSPPSESSPQPLEASSETGAPTNLANAPQPGAATNSASGTTVPVERIRGRILTRNEQARFVVIELIFSPIPEQGRRLEVLRDGKKVGELRTSRWNRSGLVAADIIEGEAQPGDEIRAE